MAKKYITVEDYIESLKKLLKKREITYSKEYLNCVEEFIKYYISDKNKITSLWTRICENYLINFAKYNIIDNYEKRINKLLSFKRGITKEQSILKYGEVQGIIFWDNYRKKQAETNTFEYKQKKYGWTEEQFREYNLSRAVTLENLVLKHGEEEGIKKWEEYCYKQKYTNTIEYFIEQYGEEEGNKKYYEYNQLKGMCYNPEYIAVKYNISIEDAVEKIRNQHRNLFVSELEMEICEELLKILSIEKVYYGNGKQFGLWDSENKKYYFYDFVDSHKKKIIEINGDYWHCNPKIYNENSRVFQKDESAEEIWKADRLKIECAKKKGFDIFVIWEYDWNNNKEETIQKILEFWNGKES